MRRDKKKKEMIKFGGQNKLSLFKKPDLKKVVLYQIKMHLK